MAKTPTDGGAACLTLASALCHGAGLPVTLVSGYGSRLSSVLVSHHDIGALAFVLSVVVMAVAVPLGQHLLRSHGNYVAHACALTQTRIILGASALIAIAAIIVTAVSAIVRRPAAAIPAGVGVFLLPFVVASAAGGGTADWLLRLTPAAGMSMMQALTHYHQVSYPYTLTNGYYPLSPVAGFAVLSGYAVLAVTAATLLLNRRDA